MPGYVAVTVSGTETDYASAPVFGGGFVVTSGQVGSFAAPDSVFEGGVKVPQTLTIQGTYVQISSTSLSNTIMPVWIADNNYQVTGIRGRNQVAGGANSLIVFEKILSGSVLVTSAGLPLTNSFYDLTITAGSSFAPTLLNSTVNSSFVSSLTFAAGDWLTLCPVANGNPISSWQITLTRV